MAQERKGAIRVCGSRGVVKLGCGTSRISKLLDEQERIVEDQQGLRNLEWLKRNFNGSRGHK